MYVICGQTESPTPCSPFQLRRVLSLSLSAALFEWRLNSRCVHAYANSYNLIQFATAAIPIWKTVDKRWIWTDIWAIIFHHNKLSPAGELAGYWLSNLSDRKRFIIEPRRHPTNKFPFTSFCFLFRCQNGFSSFASVCKAWTLTTLIYTVNVNALRIETNFWFHFQDRSIPILGSLADIYVDWMRLQEEEW